MTDATTIYDLELAAYAEASGWTLVRDNEAGEIGRLPVFALRAYKGGFLVGESSWFGIRSQRDAERRLFPFMRDFDALVESFAEAIATTAETVLTWISRGWLAPTLENLAKARRLTSIPRHGDLTEEELQELFDDRERTRE